VERLTMPGVVVLDRLILLAMLAGLAIVLTMATVLQLAFGEVPCPLCLLERVAMFGCCFGIVRQLHAGETETGSERGTGLGLVFALMLLVISVRQTLLDIAPRPGHAYVGQAVMGLHMPVWCVVIAVGLLAGFALRLALFGAPRATMEAVGLLHRSARLLEAYVALLCAVNFVAVVLQCGLGECHPSGYRLL
jgi:disulfide bond formation protein DsbB